MNGESDAAIIGAGPAGCAAAIQLAKAGLRVVLIEASEFPRHRPGETLHPGAEPLFEKLGVADAVNAAGFVRHRGNRIRWEIGGEERFEAFGEDERGEWLGYQAWRPDLDRILLDAAKGHGVDVWQPCRAMDPILVNGRVVGVECCRGTLRAKVVFDAGGRLHWMTRKLGVRWQAHSPELATRYGYVALDSGILDSGDWSNPRMVRDRHGWTWTARVRAEVVAWVRLQFDGSDPGADWQPPELATGDALRDGGGADVTWRIADRVAGPGWFALGDAAAVLDPASSHGVLRALMSGMQAADLALRQSRFGIAESEGHLAYDSWLRKWFHSDADRLRGFYGWGGETPKLAGQSK